MNRNGENIVCWYQTNGHPRQIMSLHVFYDFFNVYTNTINLRLVAVII